MELNDYQQLAGKTAIYKGRHSHAGLLYTGLGLAGEGGEVANKVKKTMRDTDVPSNFEIMSEVGDTLWYVAMICEELGYTLEECANWNIEKLKLRAAHDKIKGSGDKR